MVAMDDTTQLKNIFQFKFEYMCVFGNGAQILQIRVYWSGCDLVNTYGRTHAQTQTVMIFFFRFDRLSTLRMNVV